LWDRAEKAETYNRETYAEVAKAMAKVIDGTPQVETYEVANSTFHKIGPLLQRPEADRSLCLGGRGPSPAPL